MRPITPTIHRRELQGALSRLPAFEGCDRRVLGPLLRWGDLVQADTGRILAREDHCDFWFFVVLSGSVTLGRRGRRIATLGPGSHFGEASIVGLRPQPATVTTAEPCVLFVLGVRYFLSLLADSKRFQHNLFPDVDARGFVAFKREMLEQARGEWGEVLSARRPQLMVGSPWRSSGPLRGGPLRGGPLHGGNGLPGRTLSVREAAAIIGRLPPAVDGPASAPAPLPRSARAAVAVSIALAGAVGLFAYHPPVAVVTAGPPVDVAHDITISGAPSHRPTGRYLLLWVRTTRPNLLGALFAFAHHEQTLSVQGPVEAPSDVAEARRIGRMQYLTSQQFAIVYVEAANGVQRLHPSIHIRDRGFSGPSAGLIYALALSDMLGARDLSYGRTIAATGAIESNGKVDDVGWVSIKQEGADAGRATILLVPEGQAAEARGTSARVYSVSDIADAIAILMRTR